LARLRFRSTAGAQHLEKDCVGKMIRKQRRLLSRFAHLASESGGGRRDKSVLNTGPESEIFDPTPRLTTILRERLDSTHGKMDRNEGKFVTSFPGRSD